VAYSEADALERAVCDKIFAKEGTFIQKIDEFLIGFNTNAITSLKEAQPSLLDALGTIIFTADDPNTFEQLRPICEQLQTKITPVLTSVDKFHDAIEIYLPSILREFATT
jgi:hypothetical protein